MVGSGMPCSLLTLNKELVSLWMHLIRMFYFFVDVNLENIFSV